MITVKTFGNYKRQNFEPELMTGCDHDQNVYHYRLVDGAMVLRGIALGSRWETRQMDWRGLSCYKRKEDEQMALITKDSGRPESRADKDEIMAKAKVLIAGGTKVAQAARELGVPGGTLAGWLSKERRQMEKARRLLESVDSGKGLQSKATEVVICADCGQEIAGCVFTGKGHGPRCFKCAVKKDYDQDNTTDFNVNYEPEDNDFADDEPIPVVKPEPIDAQIDIMIDLYLADRKAKLKAHLKSLMADPEVMDAIKAMIEELT